MRASLTIGGIELALSAPRGPMENVLHDRYSPFLGAVVDPVCRIAVVDNGRVRGQENSTMATVRRDSDEVVHVDQVDFVADLDLTGDGTVTAPADPFVVDHFFRVVFALLAPRHDALMLHSAGIISGGSADVFAGQSGAGKSTLSSLAGSRPLLSDEHVLVRRRSDAWIAASTPFWGSYAKPGPARQAPLSRLWSLKKWPTNEVRPLDPMATLRIAIENAVLADPDPGGKREVFAVAADLASAVPSAELRFVPTPEVWEEIDVRAVA
jgi:hypothetical protein